MKFQWENQKEYHSFTTTLCFRLENDIKRLKADLQMSRNTEQEVRSQMNSYILDDKNCRSELYQLQQDNEDLQNK